MYKSSSEFKNKVETIALPGSSIGVYNLYEVDSNKAIANRIIDIFCNGIKSKKMPNIIHDIVFYGTTSDFGYREIYYSVIPQIIVAIPEVLTTYNLNTYYLGTFETLDVREKKYYERDNGNVEKLWFYDYMNHIGVFPKEFILGAILYDDKNDDGEFISNPYYLGLKDEIEQKKIVSDIFKVYPNSLKDVGVRQIKKDYVEEDYKRVCSELENIKYSNTYYLEQYKNYLEKTYNLYKKRK